MAWHYIKTKELEKEEQMFILNMSKLIVNLVKGC